MAEAQPLSTERLLFSFQQKYASPSAYYTSYTQPLPEYVPQTQPPPEYTPHTQPLPEYTPHTQPPPDYASCTQQPPENASHTQQQPENAFHTQQQPENAQQGNSTEPPAYEFLTGWQPRPAVCLLTHPVTTLLVKFIFNYFSFYLKIYT